MGCDCCPESFRKEFRWRKCGLTCVRSSCFYCSQFKIPEVLFVIYKAVFAIYTLIWLVINIVEAPGAENNNGQSSFVFLTTWSYILLNLYLYISLGDAVYMTYRHSRDGDVNSVMEVLGHRLRHAGNKVNASETDHEEHDYRMTWYHKLVWIVHDMISGAAPVVTLIYFAFLYPLAVKENPNFASSFLDVNIHGINTIIMIIDNFLSAIPIRIMHIVYPQLYGLIYIIFSLVYYSFDTTNNILYPDILDWNKPEITIPVIIVILGVLMPLVQLAWYGWYRLRLLIFHKIYHFVYDDPAEL